jgi:hypothetical protein
MVYSNVHFCAVFPRIYSMGVLRAQQEQERMAKKEVETQMQQFIGASANSAYIRAPERAVRR